MNQADLYRISAEGLVSLRTVQRVYRGVHVHDLSHARVRRAAIVLELPEPPPLVPPAPRADQAA